MPLLEDIRMMRQRGLDDSAVVQQLKERGASPKDIADALGQEKIRKAVTEETEAEGLQPSISTQENAPVPAEYSEQTQEAYAPEAQYAQADYSQDYSQQVGSDNISEIAEQIAEEKITPIVKSLDILKDFKELSEEKIKQFDRRVERIEKIIDQIQVSIIKKMGENSEVLQNLKKDLAMTQDAFVKVVEKKTPAKKEE
ncbi:MAG: hypothetical protein AABX65_03225 [Nanoarchaeota archaeon]